MVTLVAGMENVEKELLKDPIGKVTFTAISEAVAEIQEVNKVLLATEDGRTSKADVLKALKGDNLPENIQVLVKTLSEARKAFQEAEEAALNTYRVEVLKEEPVKEPEVDKDRVTEIRKTAMEGVKFLSSYAKGTQKTSFAEWAEKVQIPQIGRQGSSSLGGSSKPRVYVKVNDTVHGSFTEAAAALSSKKQKVTAAELAEAWNSATEGQEGSFEYTSKNDNDEAVTNTLVITKKPKKSEKK